ncbi:chemotaxis response regulator protein-glutamate methylesterase [Sneathiella sp.]|uniref:protein-glutamate methylesterase/protein-glutamine glutaminase n=1 Tax=Sneathiella sp. TaxID=1964365 RepID=UPI0025EE45CB|nr:chemotaxis response regulator protein-glutamate methylesterase [Sneathiella sp.]
MIQAETIAQSPKSASGDPYRVMVVDDSAVIRGFLSRWLDAEADIHVVALASNGAMALREFERAKPELVILDIEMPEMDGLTALPKLVALDPDVQVIMASTLTRRNADVSLKALSMGAADYIAKPESTRVADDKENFQRGLVEKVRALGSTRRSRDKAAGKVVSRPVIVPEQREHRTSLVAVKTPATLRQISKIPQIKALAIGASTGGPQALFKLLAGLKDKINLPIFITQHMPATFTTILAEHLSKIYGKDCLEAVDGERVQDNRVYVAPGNWHLTVHGQVGNVVIKLNQEAPENYCRPSVDPMLRSLQSVYGTHVLTTILTGMGHDGLEGCRKLAESGAVVIGQDEETSVVWGMPGAVASAGLCTNILPLQKISGAIENFVNGRPA